MGEDEDGLWIIALLKYKQVVFHSGIRRHELNI